MPVATLDYLREQVELSEILLAKRDTMFAPQDLPGRYGRVVQAVDHLLSILGCPSVLAGGWAVWRHGYLGRMTQDISDISVALGHSLRTPTDAVQLARTDPQIGTSLLESRLLLGSSEVYERFSEAMKACWRFIRPTSEPSPMPCRSRT